MTLDDLAQQLARLEYKVGEHQHQGFDNTKKLPNTVTTGSGAATTTPNALGLMYFDLAASPKIYIATGTGSSGSWTLVN